MLVPLWRCLMEPRHKRPRGERVLLHFLLLFARNDDWECVKKLYAAANRERVEGLYDCWAKPPIDAFTI